jgi:hypothetical protein
MFSVIFSIFVIMFRGGHYRWLSRGGLNHRGGRRGGSRMVNWNRIGRRY